MSILYYRNKDKNIEIYITLFTMATFIVVNVHRRLGFSCKQSDKCRIRSVTNRTSNGVYYHKTSSFLKCWSKFNYFLIVTLVCSDCECIGMATSLSGVYEITIEEGLTSVYCEMTYGFDWTVILFFNDNLQLYRENIYV